MVKKKEKAKEVEGIKKEKKPLKMTDYKPIYKG